MVDDLGILRNLLLAPDACVEVRHYAPAVLADHHLARRVESEGFTNMLI